MKFDVTSKYILAIVGIVALVGIVVMIMNNVGDFSNDISGQATAASCGDGTCVSPENSRNCPADCGAAPVCGDGTCTSPETQRSCPVDCKDGDRDTVIDSLDVCPGYDDRIDADSDAVPDGCDDDDDGDGYTDTEEVAAGTDSLDVSDYPIIPMVYVNGGISTKIYGFSTTGSGASRYPTWEASVDNPVQSGVTYADGVVYGGGADLYALDADDGTQIWRSSAPTGIISQPAVYNDKVYIGSRDNKIYAINIEDGTTAWTYTTGGFVLERPTLYNNILYVPSDDDYLYALNADDGSLVWSYDVGSDSDSVAVSDGIVYVGAHDAYIYALDAVDGSLVWSYRTADDGKYILSTSTLHSPTVAEGVVYIDGITYAGSSTYNYYLYAFDANDGSKLWTTSVDSMIRAAPLVEGGIIYFVTEEGYTYAVDASTGTEIWQRAPTGDYHSGVSTPALYDGVLYVGTSEAHLQALDADDGSRLWYGLTNSYVRGQIYVSS